MRKHGKSHTQKLLFFLERLYQRQTLPQLVQCILHGLPDVISGDNYMVAEHNPVDQRHSQLCLRYPVNRENLLKEVHESGAMKGHPLWEPPAPGQHTKVLSDMMSASAWASHPMYCEILREERVLDHLTVEFHQYGHQWAMIGLSRTRRGFHERDRETLAMLAPHFRQAFANARQMMAYEHNLSESISNQCGDFFPVDYAGHIIGGEDKLAAKWNVHFAERTKSHLKAIRRWTRAGLDHLNRGGLEADLTPLQLECAKGVAAFRLYRRWGHEGYGISGHFLPVGTMRTQTLTPRERDVLAWVRQGKTNEEIGIILGCSRHTVNDHLKNIYRKLHVTNRTAAANFG
ncbi:MAG TPA: helix-turn-helix transcriptional regulator [Kiritimatiellia bacterium]|nr:helix-turn-helix transcriptional regulator [Kiritimatiellia bacterium]